MAPTNQGSGTEQGREDEQCRALTADGERCSRTAGADGFCYQHDESDATVDETAALADGGSAQAAEEAEDSSADDEETADSSSDGADGDPDDGGGDGGSADGDRTESAVEEVEDSADDGESSTGDGQADAAGAGSDDDVPTIVAVRRAVTTATKEVIGRPLDGITEVSPQEDGWRVHVEVVERAAVPDTQDILGEYELDVNEDREVVGYRRLDRYRRSDTESDRLQ